MTALAGCSSGPVPAAKTTQDGIRVDPEPITSRFPAVEELISVVWVGGRMGEARVPGPSTYWIDAIAEVPESVHRDLHVGELEPATLPERFHEDLTEHVPPVSFRSSAELRGLFQYRGGETMVLLGDDAKSVVISAVFE